MFFSMGWLGSLALSRNWPFVVIPEMKDHAELLSKIVFAYIVDLYYFFNTFLT